MLFIGGDLKTITMDYTLPTLNEREGDTNKRWFIYYSFRNPENNKLERQLVWISSKLKTKTARRKQAQELILSITNQLKKGWSPYGNELPELSRLFDAVEFVLKLKIAQTRKSTASSYKTAANKFFLFLKSENLENITCQNFSVKKARKLMDNILLSGVGNTTYNNNLRMFRLLFSELILRDFFTKNPFKEIKMLPETQGNITPFSKIDFHTVFDYLRENDKQLLLFAKFIYYTGFRPIEITRMQIKDIDFINGKVVMRAQNHKSGRQRGMILKKSFLEDLKHLREYPSQFYIFSTNMKPGKKYVDTRRVQERYKLIKDELGLTNRLYDFKHTMACFLIRQKVNILSVKNYLGHQDIQDTMIYIRSVEEYSSDELKDVIPDMADF